MNRLVILRKQKGMKQFNTRKIYDIVDVLGVILLKKSMLDRKYGMFLRDIFGNETITIDNNLNKYQIRIVIDHVLGYVILHTNLNVSYCTNSLICNNKLELQANKFAAELLIPDENYFNLDIYDTLTIKDLNCLFKVTEEFIKLKFNSDYLKDEIKDYEFKID